MIQIGKRTWVNLTNVLCAYVTNKSLHIAYYRDPENDFIVEEKYLEAVCTALDIDSQAVKDLINETNDTRSC